MTSPNSAGGYGDAPHLDYRAVTVERGGRLRGLAIFRVRHRGPLWEAAVSELIVPRGERRAAWRLLRRVAAAAPVDYLSSVFPTGSASARAVRLNGFVRSSVAVPLTVQALDGKGIVPDPVARSSWALLLGDLEVL